VVRSTIIILSTSSVGLCHGGSCSWAMVVACLPVSLVHRCAALCTTLACREWAHARCPSRKAHHHSKGGQCSAAMPVPVVESLSWPEWSEPPPAMVWLRWEQAEPPCCASGKRGGRSPPLRLKPCRTPRWSHLSWPTGGTVAHY
jgi:hypothetical protein